MSNAPERIWTHRNTSLARYEPLDGWTQYVRADLAGLPEELVGRAYKARGGWDGGRITGQALDSVLHDILAWHEQQGGGE